MQSPIPWVVSKVAFPIYHWIKRDGVLRAISELESSQWKSPQELYSLQAEKLVRLLEHCERNVPYYSRLFADLGLKASDLVDYRKFTEIPPLTKTLINAHRDSLCASGSLGKDLVRNTTSGSTGESLVFFNDRESIRQRQAVVVRNQKWVGALYSDREARLWGAQMDLDKLLDWRGRLHGFIHNTIQLSSYEMSNGSMEKYAEILNRFRPKLLISYPSPLALFARFLIERDIRIPSIRSIITSAEMLHGWQREVIVEAFACPVFDRYGCREFGNIAHECEQHEGYHVNVERVFLEILDDNGMPVEPGQTGKLYVTDLDNRGFPFLRYEIGDLAVASNRLCSCGRGLPLIEKFEGRSFDIIRCPNGNRVAGTFWTICLRRFDGVVRFQVVQEALDALLIRLVVDDMYKKSSEAQITAAIRAKCGVEMRIRYEYVDRIETTRNGKERIVLSRLQEV